MKEKKCLCRLRYTVFIFRKNQNKFIRIRFKCYTITQPVQAVQLRVFCKYIFAMCRTQDAEGRVLLCEVTNNNIIILIITL